MITLQVGRVSAEVPESVAGLEWLPVSIENVGDGSRWTVGTDGRFRVEHPGALMLVYDERQLDRAFFCPEESARLCGSHDQRHRPDHQLARRCPAPGVH